MNNTLSLGLAGSKTPFSSFSSYGYISSDTFKGQIKYFDISSSDLGNSSPTKAGSSLLSFSSGIDYANGFDTLGFHVE